MKNILLIISLVLSFNTFAGQEKGGGMVIKVQNSYTLFDFFEHGLENTATLSRRVNADHWNLIPYLTASLNNDSELAKAISNKLYDIFEKNTHFGYVLYREFFSQYSLKIVNSELLETKDIGASPVIPPAGSIIYQAAIRDDLERIVWINSQLWKTLSLEHKAGLIFHEAIYAIFVLKRGDDSSSSSRALTAYVFDPSFDHQSSRSFYLRLASYFPQFLLGGSPVLNNEEAIEWDIVNDYAKLKKEVLELAKVFDHYGTIFEQRFEKQIRKLLTTSCKREKLVDIAFHNSAEFNFNQRWDIKYNNQVLNPIAYQLNPDMKWECVVWKSWSSYPETKNGRFEIITNKEMELLKSHTNRLLEIKEMLNLYPPRKDSVAILLRDDPEFQGLLNWLSYPAAHSRWIVQDPDSPLKKIF